MAQLSEPLALITARTSKPNKELTRVLLFRKRQGHKSPVVNADLAFKGINAKA